MKPATSASFSLDSYKIVNLNYNQGPDKEILEVGFAPSGKFITSASRFILSLGFVASYTDENTSQQHEILKITMEAEFKFVPAIEFEELPTYFYRNGIAIVFPYLRAMVSTITSVANSKPLILPIMNLSSLEGPLRENTKKE